MTGREHARERAPGCQENGCRDHGCRDERGSGTVLVLGIVTALVVVLLALGALAQAQVARGTAQAGADLAALAAARAQRDGWDPCERAGAVARRNGTVVTGCAAVGDGSVRVDVAGERGVRVLGVRVGSARASARAGPASLR
ncbi:Rv3654c family TadE-like protein [Cellulosimicrobium arenosum]|uniref:Flp pilus-assembly TadE/G-like family protein n=1 Tax=Cellulosimicrobium arenosum TaxID=2708133 RepID=A0A927G8Z5_9MICO|nr:flp pilus-assembly TadE/G-like family protein [Cellulosimicrobium arenosum]